MYKKSELNRVKSYFREHPLENKYSHTESGLASSYIIDRSTNRITRLANKSELDQVAGTGAFGRVKKSEAESEETVMKIQIRPIEEPEFMEETRQDLEEEAACNLDFGIAKGPLIERIDAPKGRVKYYQEMIRLDETLHDRIPNLNPNQRIKTAIDFLLLVEDCHNGELTQSGNGYQHGDLSSGNVMYDQHGKLRLIDFGFSKKLIDTAQLQKEYKDVMRTLFHEPIKHGNLNTGPATIFDPTQFNGFPIHLQKTLAWQENLRPQIPPEQNIIFIAAVLIAYQENSELSETDIENLKGDVFAQIMLVEQYKRKEAIIQMPTPIAQKTLNQMLHTLERYQRFLNTKCEQYGSFEEKMLFEEKRAIITRLTHSIRENIGVQAPQELLAKLDRVLLENESVLSPVSRTRLTGVVSYIQSIAPWFSGDISTQTLTQKIDKQINMSTHVFRSAMQEQRDRSGTTTSDSSKDDGTSEKSEDSPHRR